MDLSTFFALLTPAGQEVLSAAMALMPREIDFLANFQILSRRYSRELARVALEIAILRGEAASKFPQAEKMYFVRDALQQASSDPVSVYRASRYQEFASVVDLGCSIGGDTQALAHVTSTLGIDHDRLRLAMAQANLKALSLQADLVQSDLLSPLPLTNLLPNAPALFFDPARRIGTRRIYSVKNYVPPLDIIEDWRPRFPDLGVKISPGVNLDELGGFDAEIEFISHRGELKEAVLWFGSLRSGEHRATILPGPYSMSGSPSDVMGERLSDPQAYIYEPDPAILRAGLVRDLAAQLDACQLDPDIAYLTAPKALSTPFARVWAIADWFPFQLKRLRTYLRERNIGHVVIKKRGSPLQPEALIRDLRLEGDGERVLFLTHLRGLPIVIVGYAHG